MRPAFLQLVSYAVVALVITSGTADARRYSHSSYRSHSYHRSYSYHPQRSYAYRPRHSYHRAYRYHPHYASYGSGYYTSVSGHSVHRPVFTSSRPAGATAHCADGSWSFSEHRRGTCSHHGGIG